jgi:hypothetical protein
MIGCTHAPLPAGTGAAIVRDPVDPTTCSSRGGWARSSATWSASPTQARCFEATTPELRPALVEPRCAGWPESSSEREGQAEALEEVRTVGEPVIAAIRSPAIAKTMSP